MERPFLLVKLMNFRLFLFAFLVLSPTLFAGEYSFLKDIKGIIEISDGERTFYLAGEQHPGANSPEAALYAHATAEALRAAATEKLVVIHEHTNRSEIAEVNYLKRRGLDASKWAGAYRGLEDPALKAYTIVGLVSLLSLEHRQAIAKVDTDELGDDELAQAEQIKDGSARALFELLPQLVFTLTQEPCGGYWPEVASLPKLKQDSACVALDAVVKIGTRVAFEKHERKLHQDPKLSAQTLAILPEVTSGLRQHLIDDAKLDRALRDKLPAAVFTKEVVEPKDIAKFMDAMSPLREEAMAATIEESAKTFPKHDILIIVGRAHQLPLEKRLRSRLKK